MAPQGDPRGGRQGEQNVGCGRGESLKVCFWPNEGFWGEELDLFLESKNGLSLRHEAVGVARRKHFPTILERRCQKWGSDLGDPSGSPSVSTLTPFQNTDSHVGAESRSTGCELDKRALSLQSGTLYPFPLSGAKMKPQRNECTNSARPLGPPGPGSQTRLFYLMGTLHK